MILKIRSKKHLQKIADAMRLLHPDMNWMWVASTGILRGSIEKPITAGGLFGYASVNSSSIMCNTEFEVKIPVEDTLVQLRSTENAV